MNCPQITKTIQLANDVALEVVDWCAKTEPDNPLRVGMCDNASVKFMELFNERSEYNSIRATTTHGELVHTPRIKSEYWSLQHTWNVINIAGVGSIYVDVTGIQFRDIFEDIPSIYVSTEPPKWYLPDSKNVCYKPNSIGRRLNHYVIHIPTPKRVVHAHLMEFITHGVVGFLSDHFLYPFLKA